MTDFDYDLFVIGGGSGGVRAARMSAQYGAKVAVAEEYRYGGTCVIRGCVPKKLMVYASSFSEAFEDAAGFGWTVGETRFDWKTLIANKDKEIDRLESIYSRNLVSAGCNVFHQRATVVDPHTVRLADGRECRTRHILVATGGTPFVPGVPRLGSGDHLERGLPPGGAACPHPDRRWRLHRVRVRLHPERARIQGDPALPPRPDPARLRRRGSAGMSRTRCNPRASTSAMRRM